MSFILDALKKSEIERQRQTVPGLMDTRLSKRRTGLPVWALALGALLAVNLIVLAFVLTRGNRNGASAPPAAIASQGTGTGMVQHPLESDHFSPLNSAPVYAPEIPVTNAETDLQTDAGPARKTVPRLRPRSAPPGGIDSADRLGGAGGAGGGGNSGGGGSVDGASTGVVGAAPSHAQHRPDPVLNTPDDQADNEEALPSISELNLTGAQALPELHLDVHVYGTKPSERFVYINMRKYHEGGTLQEGPIVEHIRRDGVVLSYHGLRFMLPRQS